MNEYLSLPEHDFDASDVIGFLEDEACQMTSEQLLMLSAENLQTAVDIRLESVIGDRNPDEAHRYLKGPKQIYHIVSLFALTMDDGGLADVLEFDEPDYLAMLPAALRRVHADQYADLVTSFLNEYPEASADFHTLSFDDITRHHMHSKRLIAKYGIEEFNDAFDMLYDECPLEDYLDEYIRARITAF